ncbi:MAG: pilus assembly protein [Burkholderiales bacterium]
MVFTFDDSGSMYIECHEDALCLFLTDGRFIGTVPYGMGTGGTRQKNAIATFNPTNLYNRQMRSAQVNNLYYNPAVRYQPWVRADLTRFPNSNPAAAVIDPRLAVTTTVNLLITQTVNLSGGGLAGWCTSRTNCATSPASESFYLPQYFTLNGTNSAILGSYTQTVIRGTGTLYPRAAERSDCVTSASTCTLVEELQNFANWFTYYRSRVFSAIGGTAEAFQNLPTSYRLGYGRINQASSISIDGVNSQTLVRGVRPFTGTGRQEFYTWLTTLEVTGPTPLRRATGDIGQYYSRSDNSGPWGNTPGTNDTTPQLGCRRAYHVLTTDGSWNDVQASLAAARADNDSTTGPTINGPDGRIYNNTAARPYSDGRSNTLADVASYYWKNDLRPDLANMVVSTSENPAFWQSMTNYTVAFGLNGILNNPADLPALTAGTLNWSDVSTGTANPAAGTTAARARIDDLWHASINSRGRAFSANNPTAFSEALLSIVRSIEDREGSEAGVAVSGRQLTSSTRKYVPEYRTGVWSGRLAAIPLDANAEGDSPVWQAADSIPLPANRRIYTYKDASTPAVTFTWADLQAQGMTATLNVTAAQGTGLVAYLRGDRTGEGTTYRSRSSPLGDIVNSSPILVRDLVDLSYDFTVSGTPGRTTYRQFLNRKSRRIAQVFVGANDGMFHVFSDVAGTETFAFMPRAVLGTVRFLASSPYNHRYYVDGPALETDVYSAAASDWRNIVVASGGAGAKNLFAINVPTPSAAVAAGTATAALYPPGPSDILWEISSAASDYNELGHVLQTPEAGLMRDGTWVVITGNGYESTSRRAQLFIINALTGALIRRIDTGVGSTAAGNQNGLGGVRVVRDFQQRIVSAYGGDLLGNVWKFDLSGNTAASWDVAFGSTAATPRPLYRALNRQGQPEPITSAPTYVLHPLGGVMVLTGSGKLFEESDPGTVGERTLYGLWDRVAVGANSSSSSTTTGPISGTASLVLQSITNTITVVLGSETQSYFSISANRVNYATARGWRLPLTIQAGQRLTYDPQVADGRVFYETLVPASAAAATCQVSNTGIGYNFVIDPLTGAAGLEGATFDTNNDGLIDGTDNANAAGYKTTADGSGAILKKGKNLTTPPSGPITGSLCKVGPCACGTAPCINACPGANCQCPGPNCVPCYGAGIDSCLAPPDQTCGYTVDAEPGSRKYACSASSYRRNWRQLFAPPF